MLPDKELQVAEVIELTPSHELAQRNASINAAKVPSTNQVVPIALDSGGSALSGPGAVAPTKTTVPPTVQMTAINAGEAQAAPLQPAQPVQPVGTTAAVPATSVVPPQHEQPQTMMAMQMTTTVGVHRINPNAAAVVPPFYEHDVLIEVG